VVGLGRDGLECSSHSGGVSSIAWLLRFVAHPITVFIWYRVALGLALVIALGTGYLSAT